MTRPDRRRHPLRHSVFLVRRLTASGQIAVNLMLRDLRGEFRQTLLGYTWILIPAVVTTLVWVFLTGSDIVQPGDVSIPYPVYVLTGSLLWQGFGDALASPLRAVTGSADLLNKVNFPAAALVLGGLGQVTIFAFARMLVILPACLLYGVSLPLTALLAPFGLVMLLLLGFGIGLVLAPIGALYRDVQRAITVGLTLWFLVTPVAYLAPDSGVLSVIARWNPVAPLLETTRSWMVGGELSLGGASLVSGMTVCLVVLGLGFFHRSIPHLVDRLVV